MTLDDLKLPLKVWVNAATGFLAVWGDENNPQPQPPFARLRFLTRGKQMTFADKNTIPADSDGVTTFIVNPDDFTLEVQFYGDGAVSAASALENAWQSDTLQAMLNQNQVEAVIVTAAVSGAAYSVRIQDVGISYTAGPSDTLATITTALIDAINANLDVHPYAAPITGKTAQFTITDDSPFLFSVGAHLTYSEQSCFHIPIYQSHGVQNTTGIVDSQTVESAALDLDMGAIFLQIDTPGVIETVEGTGGFTEGGEVVETVTLDITGGS